MGLSSIPSPSEGMVFVILANTAFSISILKGLVRLILRVVGFGYLSSPAESRIENAIDEEEASLFALSDCYVEEFRSRSPAVRFDALCCCKKLDCSVCLTEFEPESEINCLSCGHLFHRVCLEKWLGYWNITCPLCRTPLLPEEVTSGFW